jgi:hypothetical protein
MAIEVSTAEYERVHGSAPRGNGFWEFEATGEAVGNRQKGPRSYLFSTDGPWSRARKQALEGARTWFGTTAEVTLVLTSRSAEKGE